ncbi:MAG: DUF5659 domain-containing protein [Patescibacteria group bacterium]|nr:DUF5659 domain-containing protein [Patescibacteria group bacterium]MDD5121132.1 DUF5659 domain-containing protein [Patescibacteria group bacterium]MDD5221647.1 DUF5659 domain-containing protein [Patescibacteria group bacterium]MDD5395949.1 DUF5659 domain-containing protein [Patescibacteria group bacterium]
MKREISKQNDFFESSDLTICTTLCYFGYQIETISRQISSKVIFSIKKDEKLDELIQKYWAHQLLVEPMAFFNCLKEIKSRIYSSLPNN